MRPEQKAAIMDILKEGDKNDVRALFQFNEKTSLNEVLFKFRLWVRYFYPGVFKAKDAPFHKQIDIANLQVYRGEKVAFVDIVFRDGAKTTRTKFFIAFCIANDFNKRNKLIKFLAKDVKNARQNVTDVYNALISRKHAHFYPELFEKTDEKRQESMSVFMTSTGIQVISDSVGVDQRGDQVFSEDEIQRPNLLIFDDFETRKTLHSAVETHSIWENMGEAIDGIAQGGGAVYLCNYISESGNVHKLVQKYKNRADAEVLIVPILDDLGNVAWDRYTKAEVEQKMRDSNDPDGEYMCNPVAGFDVFIDREKIDAQIKRKPKSEIAGFRMYHDYNPSHRLAGGHDVAGGVGLDSSASVFIDFSTIPARVVGTYASNSIIPEDFGHEMIREAAYFGNPLLAPERNYGTECILILKQHYKGEIYKSAVKKTGVNEADRMDFGYHTNRLTKPEGFHAFKKAVEDGLLELSDERLIDEARSYTRNDLMDRDVDARLTTRHFDLLTAAVIAWQMKDEAEVTVPEEEEESIEEMLEAEKVENIFDQIGA